MEHSDDRSDQWSSDEIEAMKAKSLPPLEFNKLKTTSELWYDEVMDDFRERFRGRPSVRDS